MLLQALVTGRINAFSRIASYNIRLDFSDNIDLNVWFLFRRISIPFNDISQFKISSRTLWCCLLSWKWFQICDPSCSLNQILGGVVERQLRNVCCEIQVAREGCIRRLELRTVRSKESSLWWAPTAIKLVVVKIPKNRSSIDRIELTLSWKPIWCCFVEWTSLSSVHHKKIPFILSKNAPKFLLKKIAQIRFFVDRVFYATWKPTMQDGSYESILKIRWRMHPILRS